MRQWFSRQRKDEKITQGRAILDQTFKHLGLGNMSPTPTCWHISRATTTLDDFLEAIGNTDISPQNITGKLGEHRQEELLPDADSPPARDDPHGHDHRRSHARPCRSAS